MKDEIAKRIVTIEQMGGNAPENLFIQLFNTREEANKKSAEDAVFMEYWVFISEGWNYIDIDIDWTKGVKNIE